MATNNKVRLYYLGGLTQAGVSRPVTSAGRGYMLPPVGEYLDVPEYAANDLMRKFKIVRDGVAYDVFTRDARLAQRVRNGEKVNQTARIVPRLEDLSNEALLAELRARGVMPAEKPEESPEEADAPAEPEAYQPASAEDGEELELGALLAGDKAPPPAKKQRRIS